jgi:hypothetical protein
MLKMHNIWPHLIQEVSEYFGDDIVSISHRKIQNFPKVIVDGSDLHPI